MSTEETRTFKAVVTSKASKVMSKSSGAKYVIHNCKFTEGPLAGKNTPASRTILNRDNEEKAGVEVDQEVTLYLSVGTDNDGNKKFYFEISAQQESVSTEEIAAALAM